MLKYHISILIKRSTLSSLCRVQWRIGHSEWRSVRWRGLTSPARSPPCHRYPTAGPPRLWCSPPGIKSSFILSVFRPLSFSLYEYISNCYMWTFSVVTGKQFSHKPKSCPFINEPRLRTHIFKLPNPTDWKIQNTSVFSTSKVLRHFQGKLKIESIFLNCVLNINTGT